ncbi:MAG: ATP-binding protein, partial [Smithella sp.]
GKTGTWSSESVAGRAGERIGIQTINKEVEVMGAETLAAAIGRQPDFDRHKKLYKVTITSQEAEDRKIESKCGPAPEPILCEYCESTLYYTGFLSQGETPYIFHWSDQPQRCTCPKAVKYWEGYDIEAEKKRAEEEALKERIQHKKTVEKLLQHSGISKRFQQRTFNTFVTDTPGRKNVYKKAREYAVKFSEAQATGEGLYIEGTNGTGKTHLAAAIGLYLTEQEYSVVMKTSFDLLDEIKKAFDDQTKSEHQIMRAYRECDLLIIDDLGKEQCTDWSMSILYSIVNDRYESMRPIIITTNFGDEDLIQTLTPKGYGSQKIEAIISRLREVSKTLIMAWEDCRGK